MGFHLVEGKASRKNRPAPSCAKDQWKQLITSAFHCYYCWAHVVSFYEKIETEADNVTNYMNSWGCNEFLLKLYNVMFSARPMCRRVLWFLHSWEVQERCQWKDVMRSQDRDLVTLTTCLHMTIVQDSDVAVSGWWLSPPTSVVTMFGLSHGSDHVTNISSEQTSAVTTFRQFTAEQFTRGLVVANPASLLLNTVTFSLTLDRPSTSEHKSLLQADNTVATHVQNH